MANLIGTILHDRFRVDAFVASGGMGAVYKVWDLQRNAPLALKILHADLAEDPSALKRFEREARALKKLAHPNIVPFYGLYETEDFIFLVEQFIDGQTLKDIMHKTRGQPMPVQDALIYLRSLCSALGYAHTFGVIHCDVKPGNVMVDTTGQIFLTDFGVARHAESTTTTYGTAGTAAYMAPEQVRGGAVSAATDLYALGILFYELLTGRRPFRADSKDNDSSSSASEQIRHAQLTQSPPDPRKINPDLPEPLARVMLKALEKDPAARYTSAQAFLEAACQAAGVFPEQIPARAVGVSGPVGPQHVQRPVPPLQSETIGDLAASAPGMTPYPPLNRQPATAANQSPPRQKRLGLAVAGVGLVSFIMLILLYVWLSGRQPTAVTPTQLAAAVNEPATESVAMTSAIAPPPSTAAATTVQPTTAAAQASIDCNQISFVQNVTIPDGTRLLPGQPFTKTWRVKNTGSCTWDQTYSLSLVTGDGMSAQPSILLPGNVPPGAMVDFSIVMIAPQAPGAYLGGWGLRDGSNVDFSKNLVLNVAIEVVAPTTTPVIQATPTLEVRTSARVLWDISHGPRISSDPGNPSYDPSGMYRKLTSRLSTLNIQVDINQHPLTATDLSKYQMVVVNEWSSVNKSYTTDEATLLKNYVLGGGGLLVMADNANTSKSAQAVCIIFDVQCYLEPNLDQASIASVHAVTINTNMLAFGYNGGALSTTNTAAVIAVNGSNVAAIADQPGAGRIIILGDGNLFDNDTLGKSDNASFADNIFRWLSGMQ